MGCLFAKTFCRNLQLHVSWRGACELRFASFGLLLPIGRQKVFSILIQILDFLCCAMLVLIRFFYNVFRARGTLGYFWYPGLWSFTGRYFIDVGYFWVLLGTFGTQASGASLDGILLMLGTVGYFWVLCSISCFCLSCLTCPKNSLGTFAVPLAHLKL